MNDADFCRLTIKYSGYVDFTCDLPNSSESGKAFEVRKYRNVGVLVWNRTWSVGDQMEKGDEIKQSENGTLFIRGFDTNSFEPTYRLWIVNPTSGAIVKNLPIRDVGSGRGIIYGMDVLANRVLIYGHMTDTAGAQRAYYEVYNHAGSLVRRKTFLVNGIPAQFRAGRLRTEGGVSFRLLHRKLSTNGSQVRRMRYDFAGAVKEDVLLRSATGTQSFLFGSSSQVHSVCGLRFTEGSNSVQKVYHWTPGNQESLVVTTFSHRIESVSFEDDVIDSYFDLAMYLFTGSLEGAGPSVGVVEKVECPKTSVAGVATVEPGGTVKLTITRSEPAPTGGSMVSIDLLGVGVDGPSRRQVTIPAGSKTIVVEVKVKATLPPADGRLVRAYVAVGPDVVWGGLGLLLFSPRLPSGLLTWDHCRCRRILASSPR